MGKKKRRIYSYDSQNEEGQIQSTGDENMVDENEVNQVPDEEAFESNPLPDENDIDTDEDDYVEPNPEPVQQTYQKPQQQQQPKRPQNVVKPSEPQNPRPSAPKPSAQMVAKMPRVSPTSYNLFGLEEVASTFEITRLQLEDYAKSLFLEYIPDLIDVKIEVDYRAIENAKIDSVDHGFSKQKNNRQSEMIYGMVYIPSDSPNIVDMSSYRTSATVMPISLSRLSQGVNHFMDQFCLKEWKKVLKSKGRSGYVAIRFSIPLLVNRGFDRDGKAYKVFCEQINHPPVEDRQCEIDIQIIWDNAKCSNVESLRITKKKYARRLTRKDLNPKSIQMY